MGAFYQHLNNGLTGREALRVAQQEAMAWNDIPHGPALWGAFALIGDASFRITGP